MTRERIADGLEILTLQLANGETVTPPPGWELHEWAYLKGLASFAILQLRASFMPPEKLMELQP